MAVLLDTGILYAYYDRRDSWHVRARELVEAESGGLILPSPVLPEVDHLLGKRLGENARLLFYRSLAEDHFLIADLPREAYRRVLEINEQFADLEPGFVDAAIIAIGESLALRRIATSDRRDFVPMATALDLQLLP